MKCHCARAPRSRCQPHRKRESRHHVNGCKILRSRLRRRQLATRPVESKPNSTMIKRNRIGIMLIASSLIEKKSPTRGWREEHEATDMRWRTRRKSPSLSLGLLDLSSRYYLKHPKIDISQKHEISRTMFLPDTRHVSAGSSTGGQPGLLTESVSLCMQMKS